MGKTTKFHPISLHVIRGAAEFCGWKFSIIKQTRLMNDIQAARYTATIQIVPEHAKRLPIVEMQSDLQSCFMQDILVQYLRRSKSGKWMVDLFVTYEAPDQPTADELSELYQSGIDV